MSFLRKPGKGGGGFLHDVSGTIDAITFKANQTGETKEGKPWVKYSGVVEITPDGGKPTVQFLDAGFLGDDLAISKDGKSITGNGTYSLNCDTQFGKFIASLVEGDGNRLPEETLGDGRNYDAIAGIRVTFARVLDVEATLARGQRILKVKTVTEDNRAKVLEAGKVKNKETGKTYMLDNLLVSEVLALPEVKAAKGKKATAAKPAAAPQQAAAVDADATLKAIIEAEGGVVEADKLQSSVVRFAVKAKMDTAARQALVKTLSDEAFLTAAIERGVVVRDGNQFLAA